MPFVSVELNGPVLSIDATQCVEPDRVELACFAPPRITIEPYAESIREVLSGIVSDLRIPRYRVTIEP